APPTLNAPHLQIQVNAVVPTGQIPCASPPAVVPAPMHRATGPTDCFFPRRTRVISRACGSPNRPCTVSKGRKPGKRYASARRRDLRVLGIAQSCQNLASRKQTSYAVKTVLSAPLDPRFYPHEITKSRQYLHQLRRVRPRAIFRAFVVRSGASWLRSKAAPAELQFVLLNPLESGDMRTEKLIRLNHLVRSPRLKFAGALALDCLGLGHLIVRFDPVLACNLRCGMCYFSDDNWLATHPVKRFSDDEIERLAAMFLPQALQLHIGCGTEPTMYKNFPKLVAIGKKYRVPFIGFTTNAQLLTGEKCAALVAEGLDEITVSTHGITRETYERMMKKASYERYHENLSNLVKAKQVAKSDTPRIRINYTVNPDNLAELRGFFDVFGKYDISTLQVRP